MEEREQTGEKVDESNKGKTAQVSPNPKSNKKKKIIIAVVCIALVAVIAVVVYFCLHKEEDTRDDSKGAIVISEDNRGGSDLNDRVASGMIAVKMTAVWTFKDGNSAGDGYVANSQHNSAPLRILVQLSDTGETVLEVDSLPIGSCVENFKLSKDLEKGNYPAIVTHSTLDEEGNITNSVRTDLQIIVEN